MTTGEQIRVLFDNSNVCGQLWGGKEVQMEQTLNWVNMDPRIQAKLFDKFNDRLENYHVYHCFGLSPDNVGTAKLAKQKGLQFVCSPVYWEPWNMGTHTQSWMRRVLSRTVHAAARSFPGLEWTSTVAPGQFLLEIADSIVPNSLAEVQNLSSNFTVDRRKVRVIPNGVEPSFRDGDEAEFKSKYGYADFILYVGRIEPRKNLASLSEAAAGLGMDLILIGSADGNRDYLEECHSRGRGRTHHLGTMKHSSSMLKSAYKSARVFVLPSWFETPGISAMEAAVAGCPIVVTNEGSTSEYFGEYAEYCNPESVPSISGAIERAMVRDDAERLRDILIDKFSWRRIGELVADTYADLLRGTLGGSH